MIKSILISEMEHLYVALFINLCIWSSIAQKFEMISLQKKTTTAYNKLCEELSEEMLIDFEYAY